MKKLQISMICFVLGIILIGCSTKPVYYSKAEVKAYVKEIFGSDYSIVDTLEYADDTEEENRMYEYVFSDGEFEFSVYTGTYHTSFDASETIFYDKKIYNNYTEQIMKYYETDLQEILERLPCEYKLGDTLLTLYLNSYDDIKEITTFIEEIDQLMALEYTSTSQYSGKISIIIYLQPNGDGADEIEEWKGDYRCDITTLALSNSEDSRLNEEDVFTTIERNLVYMIRSPYGSSSWYYSLPDNILYKYPSQYLNLVLGENEENEYVFTYDLNNGKYWCSSLDPCQDFEGVYNYTNKGRFQALVEELGGSYTCGEWEASWSIGDDIWEAELVVNDNSGYEDFMVYKNGTLLELDDPEDKNNGTSSGRGFTMEDLEKMLNIEFVINDIEQTIEIK